MSVAAKMSLFKVSLRESLHRNRIHTAAGYLLILSAPRFSHLSRQNKCDGTEQPQINLLLSPQLLILQSRVLSVQNITWSCCRNMDGGTGAALGSTVWFYTTVFSFSAY